MLRTSLRRGCLVLRESVRLDVSSVRESHSGPVRRAPVSKPSRGDGEERSGRRAKGVNGIEIENVITPGPSLYEQLFPDQQNEGNAGAAEHEVPRIPIEPSPQPYRPAYAERRKRSDETRTRRLLREEMTARGKVDTVLVLRNASKNLVEEDFRHLIPQGKNLEGWTLEQGDILRIVPGRDLATLAQQTYYYLFFSTPLSAFTYQSHATRIHQLVAAHTPSSILSPIPPPPGYLIDGLDAHAAIESFSLTAPNQNLELRQLRPPLSPVLEGLLRNGGHAALTKRQDRMPFEARLTLEGPQLHVSAIRHVCIASARDRGLGWSGGDDLAPQITQWEPPPPRSLPSPSDKRPEASSRLRNYERDNEEENELGGEAKRDTSEWKQRTPVLVFIVGFYTKRAMQSFVHFWHRRPMQPRGPATETEDGDLPPVANVEVLW